MLVTLLTIGEIVYVVGLATWILFEKRSPVSTLAWILALIALPYVGFVVFFFLGPRRLVRKRLKHQRARGKVKESECFDESRDALPSSTDSGIHDERVEPVVKLVIGAGEPPAERCEEVTIFHDAKGTYDAIEAAIAAAKHHVHVAYYIFEAGRAGTRFRDALVERAKAGVMVRLLVDDVGSSSVDREFVRPMRDAGVKFSRFNPITFSRIRSRIDFRNHRKIVVVDGVLGFTGGINICDDYVAPAEGSPLSTTTGSTSRISRILRSRSGSGNPAAGPDPCCNWRRPEGVASVSRFKIHGAGLAGSSRCPCSIASGS